MKGRRLVTIFSFLLIILFLSPIVSAISNRASKTYAKTSYADSYEESGYEETIISDIETEEEIKSADFVIKALYPVYSFTDKEESIRSSPTGFLSILDNWVVVFIGLFAVVISGVYFLKQSIEKV